MTSTHRRILAALAAMCLTFGLAACGEDDSADPEPEAAGADARS